MLVIFLSSNQRNLGKIKQQANKQIPKYSNGCRKERLWFKCLACIVLPSGSLHSTLNAPHFTLARLQSEAAVVVESHGRWLVRPTRALFNWAMLKCTGSSLLQYAMGFLKGLVELVAMAALHKQSGENQLQWHQKFVQKCGFILCLTMQNDSLFRNCSAPRACSSTSTPFNGKFKLDSNFLLWLLRKIASNCPSTGSARVCANLTQRAKVFGHSWGLILVWSVAINNKKHDKNAVRVQRPWLSIQYWELIKTHPYTWQKVNTHQPP